HTSFSRDWSSDVCCSDLDDWRDLCANPELISPAVEECLRHSGSIASWRRRTTCDVEIEGVNIPAGARLLMVVNSGNRDPRHFSEDRKSGVTGKTRHRRAS